MDVTLLLLIIALIVVIVLFVVTLRAGASSTKRAAAAGSARQAADRPAIAAPQQQAQDAGARTAQDAVVEQSAAGGQQTRLLLADTSEGETPALPDNAGGARVAGDSVRYPVDISPATTVALDAPSREATEPATVATVGTENAVPVTVAPLSSDGAPADEGSVDTGTALELAGPPATRTGAVLLSVAPQRLPYRLAELLGEQRGLEEAITIAHRRIDDIELGPDPGGADNRVRLAVLRQDLSQKQERLREILFLQDGYRWLQQHLAPERAPSES